MKLFSEHNLAYYTHLFCGSESLAAIRDKEKWIITSFSKSSNRIRSINTRLIQLTNVTRTLHKHMGTTTTVSCTHVSFRSLMPRIRGTKRLVSVNICSVEGNSASIFVRKVSPGIFVIKEK